MPVVKVRPWAYRIFQFLLPSEVLLTLAKDGPNLEALIREHGELKVARAWWLYVADGEGKRYNLAPVVHVDEYTTKSGKRIVTEKEDQSQITKFVLAAFLAVPDGCLAAADDERNVSRYFGEEFLQIMTGKSPSPEEVDARIDKMLSDADAASRRKNR